MRGDVMIKPRSVAFLRRLPRSRGEGGFTLIEAVFAMVLFAGLAAAMAGLLTSAISGNKLSRQRTIADQVAMEQIESIRRLDYEDVGTILGNPPGTWPATTSVNVAGFDATVTVQIRYVDDPTPTSYETTANYKRVIVTVRRDSDNRVLAREVTYVAPTSRTPFGGVNLAIIEPLVIDYGLNVPVEGVTVDLLTGPDAPRSDVTDATGKVSFKKLTPNATANCPSDCYDLTADLPGYVQLDAPTRINVGPGQTATPTIQIYRPSTINLDLRNSGGGQLSGTAFVKLTSARNGITQTFTVTGGTAAITTVAGEPIVPSVQYTAEAWTTGTPQCATPVTQYVPDDYPDDLTSTFTLTMGACPSGSIAATVTWGSGGPAAAGATVTISGGPVLADPDLRHDELVGPGHVLERPLGHGLHGSGFAVLAVRFADGRGHDREHDQRHAAADGRIAHGSGPLGGRGGQRCDGAGDQRVAGHQPDADHARERQRHLLRLASRHRLPGRRDQVGPEQDALARHRDGKPVDRHRQPADRHRRRHRPDERRR